MKGFWDSHGAGATPAKAEAAMGVQGLGPGDRAAPQGVAIAEVQQSMC